VRVELGVGDCGVGVGVLVLDGVHAGVIVVVGGRVAVLVAVGVEEGLAVCVFVGGDVAVCVGLDVAGHGVGGGVLEGVAEAVTVTVGADVGVSVTATVVVASGAGRWVAAVEGIAVETGVGEGVGRDRVGRIGIRRNSAASVGTPRIRSRPTRFSRSA
jgi:hypothetical protein